MTFLELLRKVRTDERGTSVVEFGFLCVMIVIALIAAVRSLADENTRIWTDVSDKIIKSSSK
jgi:Flp pilus assembly pilin Flp